MQKRFGFFSFKTKMTYLKEWSILKMRAETLTCNLEKQHVEKERDFRSGSWDPGGEEEGGEGMRCAQGPPGGRSLPPSPLFLSPPPFPPKGGRTPLKFSLVKKPKVLHLLKPDTLADVFTLGSNGPPSCPTPISIDIYRQVSFAIRFSVKIRKA